MKYRLRLLGLWRNNISRAYIEELKDEHRDTEIIWTGKEYPAGSVQNFKGLNDLDAAFRTIILDKCSNVIRKRAPQTPLLFCRTEHELFWSIGLSTICPNPVVVGDCDLPLAERLGLSYVHDDLLSLSFDDEAFDLVAIPHYLYYAGVSFIPQSRFDPNGDERLLNEINRVLKPGGALVGMIFVKKGGTVLPIGFQRARDISQFHDIVRRSGFNIVEESYFHRSSMKPICASDVSSAPPRYTRPSAGFADRLLFVCEKAHAR